MDEYEKMEYDYFYDQVKCALEEFNEDTGEKNIDKMTRELVESDIDKEIYQLIRNEINWRLTEEERM